MRVDAVIFDLDGTLVDSEPLHKRAEIAAFKQLGYTITESDLLPHVGTTLDAMLASLAPGLPKASFLEVEIPLFKRMIREEMTMFPDALRLLERLALPVALATSSLPWYVIEVFNQFPVLPTRFDIVLTASDVANGKPDPEIFLRASAALGVPAEACLVIEDSSNGVRAARAAGCQTVGVQRSPLIDLSAAHRVVASLDEVDLAAVS